MYLSKYVRREKVKEGVIYFNFYDNFTINQHKNNTIWE